MSPPTGTLISGTPGMNCGWLNQPMGVLPINRGVFVFFCGYYPPKFVKFVIKSPGKFCEIHFSKTGFMLRWICRSFSYLLLRIPIFDCSQFQFFVLQIYMFVGDFPMFLVGATDYWVILGYWTLSTAEFPHIAWWIMVNLPSGKLT